MENEYNIEVEENIDSGLSGNPKLQKEYEETFTNEEKIQHAIKVTKDSFTLDIGVVDFGSLLVSEPIKNGRKETFSGLTTSIGEMGIITPIHVMVLEGYADWVESHPSEPYEGYKYSILDGFRRVWGGYKNGITRCNAVIWDFKDKDKGVELATVLSMILNKTQRRSWGEVWYMYQILNEQSVLSPSTAEYLLQLESGDAMRLSAVMQCEYPEVKEDLLCNKKTLMQCYKNLEKLQREEDKIAKEDQLGISEVEQAEGLVEKGKDQLLSDEDIKDLLEMGENFDGELSEDDFDELMGNNLPDEQQRVGERHPLDPKLRAAVLQRDGYCCQISGVGKGLPVNIALAVLNVHHLVPVHAGGTDTMENLITVSLDNHTLIHIIERQMGKLGMSKEDFDALSKEEQERIKGVMKIARIAVEANKRKGKSREQVKKDSQVPKFLMPGVIQKENMEAVNMAKMNK